MRSAADKFSGGVSFGVSPAWGGISELCFAVKPLDRFARKTSEELPLDAGRGAEEGHRPQCLQRLSLERIPQDIRPFGHLGLEGQCARKQKDDKERAHRRKNEGNRAASLTCRPRVTANQAAGQRGAGVRIATIF